MDGNLLGNTYLNLQMNLRYGSRLRDYSTCPSLEFVVRIHVITSVMDLGSWEKFSILNNRIIVYSAS